MISGDQVQALKSENELLRIQLKDVNEMIEVREEELALLRRKAEQAAMLQSKLENSLLELDFLQHELGKQQQQVFGAVKREHSLEYEVLEGIRMEKEYYEIREKFESARTELSRLHEDAHEVKKLNLLVSRLQTRVAELESQADLMDMDQGFLKEELGELRKWKEMSGG